jgi:NADPH:quinone reductase-like Zn-dependent oxidoreductase
MKAVELTGFGLENLKIVDRANRPLGPKEVRIQLEAASLNYRDYLLALGTYDPKQRLPLVPLSDGAGVVVDLGEEAKRFKVGDRVCPIFRQGWISGEYRAESRATSLGSPLDGVMSDYMALEESGLVAIPSYMSFLEAATLPCAAVTAWNALRVEDDIGPGQSVLIQGTGGVSLFALQFAKMAGAKVILTSSSDEKLERGKALGADVLINYRKHPKWDQVVREATDGVGVDHVVEVGGAETLEMSVRSARLNGHISIIGNITGSIAKLSLPLMLMRHLRFQGITAGNRDSFEAMLKAMELFKTKPVVDRVFDFHELKQALEYMASGSQFGKICISHN